MTCYEHLRKPEKNPEHSKRLESYFNALENNQLEQYQYGRKWFK